MSCPHNFLPQGGKYPLCGIDGGICFGPDHHRWDECPVYFGPWGAWRAGLAVVAAAATHPIWDPNYYDLFPEGEWGPLRAVGWSP